MLLKLYSSKLVALLLPSITRKVATPIKATMATATMAVTAEKPLKKPLRGDVTIDNSFMI